MALQLQSCQTCDALCLPAKYHTLVSRTALSTGNMQRTQWALDKQVLRGFGGRWLGFNSYLVFFFKLNLSLGRSFFDKQWRLMQQSQEQFKAFLYTGDTGITIWGTLIVNFHHNLTCRANFPATKRLNLLFSPDKQEPLE